ncbi:MAG: SIMPL domain-containing protein [Candidatus Eremiobacteraeota bacterium]|nr:SIMPL domain-containing protein [Candidatus Eremiobacteraeota bacterium]
MRSFLAALALGFWLLPVAASAQNRPSPVPPLPTLTVTGEGIVSRDPDQATVSVQIITNNDSAATATTLNNSAFNDLHNRLARLGLSDSAIKTTSYGLNFVPKPTDASQYHPPRTGYVVTRTVAITLHDLALVGRAVDAATAAGATNLGVGFGLRDRRAAYASALAAAMRDAAQQAQAIAEAGQVRLAGIRTISAGSFVTPPPRINVPMAAATLNVQQIPTVIEPSAIDVRATLTVTYDIVK